ncbi:hypothetical protein LX86_007614 [Lentzea aerocolonigenes]|nr:hypothetical protein [Lentzea aerocolonigenes]
MGTWLLGLVLLRVVRLPGVGLSRWQVGDPIPAVRAWMLGLALRRVA